MSVFLRIRVTFSKGTNRKAESAYQASRQSREMRLTWNSREFFLLLLQECHTLIIKGTRWAISCACTCADPVNENTNQNQFQFEMLHSFNNLFDVRAHAFLIRSEWMTFQSNERERKIRWKSNLIQNEWSWSLFHFLFLRGYACHSSGMDFVAIIITLKW